MVAIRRDEEKPWKTDLAKKSAQRREQVLREVEETVKKAPSFEEGLRQAVETLKRRFVRYTALTAYVADGEGLAVHTSLDRPEGPERVPADEGPLAKAAHATWTTVVGDASADEEWAKLGLTVGSVMVAPVRTEAGLWALLEIWSDFRDAFSAPDVKLIERVTAALAKKTPAA